MNAVRNTKYTDAIRDSMAILQHATNSQLLATLRNDYPELSATTVHRITIRLHKRGELGIAPFTPDGSIVYDLRSDDHDHFYCDHCGTLHDITVPKECISKIENTLGEWEITGTLVIHGSCAKCVNTT